MCNFLSLYAGDEILCHGILLWAVWVSCLGHAFTQLFMQPLTSNAWGTEKSLTLSKNCLATLKQQCVINIFLALNPNTTLLSPARKKIYFVHRQKWDNLYQSKIKIKVLWILSLWLQYNFNTFSHAWNKVYSRMWEFYLINTFYFPYILQ